MNADMEADAGPPVAAMPPEKKAGIDPTVHARQAALGQLDRNLRRPHHCERCAYYSRPKHASNEKTWLQSPLAEQIQLQHAALQLLSEFLER